MGLVRRNSGPNPLNFNFTQATNFIATDTFLSTFIFEKITGLILSMKKLTHAAFWMLAFSLVALFSCNDPSELGSDLLSGDQLQTDFTDTLTVRARTVQNDTLTVWGPGVDGVVFENFAFGDFQDPIFGRAVASIYAQIVTSTSLPTFDPDSSVIDSVVLTLSYNKDLSYGKLDEPFTIEVYQLEDSLEVSKEYFNTDSFAVKPVPLGVKTFVPNVTDSVTVMEPNADTLKTVKYTAQLRIPLDTTLIAPIIRLDTSILNHDDKFLEIFRGIWLKPASQNAGMLSFIMRSANTNIRFYYHDGAAKKYYDFKSYSGTPIVLHQRNYYGGSQVAPYLNAAGENRNDSILFLQGLNGVNIELEIPYAESLNGLIINKAELILPIINDDKSVYEPVEQIYAVEIESDTSAVVIDDIKYLLLNRPSSDFGDFFGGKVTSDNTYVLNLASQLQRMAAGDSSKKLRLTAYIRSERAARVVLAGTNHPEFPAKLKIRYTKY